MARLLLNNSRKAELETQQALMGTLDVAFARTFYAVISRASRDMVREFEAGNDNPQGPPDLHWQFEVAYRKAVGAAVDVFGGRVLDQGKAHGLILETKNFGDLFARLTGEYIQQEAIRRRITSVAEETRNRMIEAIDRGRLLGFNSRSIANGIREVIPEISRNRAATIAITEVHGAAQFASEASAKATGLDLSKEWVASGGERTRKDHRGADGQVVPMDGKFNVGGSMMDRPGDPSAPAKQTIRCRCIVAYVVDV